MIERDALDRLADQAARLIASRMAAMHEGLSVGPAGVLVDDDAMRREYGDPDRGADPFLVGLMIEAGNEF